MTTVHDVATYILEKRGEMTTMKLQKLCYYSQGWSLAWDERPLFSERIEAWANGPVVRELYNQHRGQFQVSHWPIGDLGNLDGDARETIDLVLESYGSFSGQQLSAMTHTEPPWLTAREGVAAGARANRAVSMDDMQDFFGGLAVEMASANW